VVFFSSKRGDCRPNRQTTTNNSRPEGGVFTVTAHVVRISVSESPAPVPGFPEDFRNMPCGVVLPSYEEVTSKRSDFSDADEPPPYELISANKLR